MTQAGAKPLPWHLQGNWAPVQDEIDVTDLTVEGEIPAALEGSYYRNGMNPRSGYSTTWFFGHGMVNRIQLGGGRALSFRNRYVRTPYFEKDMHIAEAVMDPTASPANTNIVRHGGRFFALEEFHSAWEMSADLETIGCFDYDGKVKGPMTPHVKFCPRTGEMLFFGYDVMGPPYLRYHRADASGALVQSEEIDLPRPVMIHDLNITRNHVVFMDLPIVFSLEAGFQFKPECGARLGVMPRTGGNADVQWHDIEPCTVFHPMNSYETDDGKIILDVCRQPSLMSGGLGDLDQQANLWRWTIDTVAGGVKEEQRDDLFCDFPRVDDRLVGERARFGYAAEYEEADCPTFAHSLLRYDLESGAVVKHDLGATVRGGEPVFVPASPDAAEDEGWILALVHDEGTDVSYLQIIDGRNFEGPPVARVRIPQRVPYGSHGNWIPNT
ncbi:MAG: carotenoid oxygenase family protein [Candidatus Binatia bacterium]|nr:carotenoid oxygenase family protein [Candidatus Binatia bacterium]